MKVEMNSNYENKRIQRLKEEDKLEKDNLFIEKRPSKESKH